MLPTRSVFRASLSSPCRSWVLGLTAGLVGIAPAAATENPLISFAAALAEAQVQVEGGQAEPLAPAVAAELAPQAGDLFAQLVPVEPAADDAPDHTGREAAVLAWSEADSLLEERYRIGDERRVLEVGRGDTLLGLLLAQDEIDRPTAHAAVTALETVFDPRRLRPGQEITLGFDHQGTTSTFAGIEVMPDVETVAVANWDAAAEGFTAQTVGIALETRRTAAAGTITRSLSADANDAGVPHGVLSSIIRAYSFDVDFQRDIHPDDAFGLMWEQDFNPDGTLARQGDVLFATLTLGDRTMPIYRFETDDGLIDYFDPDGVSVRRQLLRTPLDGARLSSGFGMRRHPILGYNRMHRGTDFAAPTGTPIYAAGNGVIDRIGTNGGYGKYIRIRHNSQLSTAYAHLSRYAQGLSRGDRVEQEQVIGYVGSTGQSTGPHLHYEVLIDGTQVNPMSIDLPTGQTLEGTELAQFEEWRDELDRQYAALAGVPQVVVVPEN